MKKFILLILLVQMGAISCLKAQIDPHFSQIYAYPLWLNPALTGVFDGDTRVTANFKGQWTGITNGYQTTAISADYKATDKVSLGLNLLDQKDGSADYNYIAAYGTLGYMIPISPDGTKKLHFGFPAAKTFQPPVHLFLIPAWAYIMMKTIRAVLCARLAV
jgi:type IX secretion system PorP/SprF family membrane protein